MSRTQDVWLLTSEGTRVSQRHVWTGGGLKAVAVGDDDVQVRSFPNSFGGQHAAGGWEVMREIALHSRARFTAMEAVELLSADDCPERVCDLILEPSQLGLQIHESIGHAAELDRVFGHEAAFAGGTYLASETVGAFQLGSEHVTISADSTVAGALGSFGWDDEGVPAGRQLLVDRGVFSGWLSNRETAGRIGQVSSGAGRASGFHRMPLVRMVNVSLEPGTAGSVEDLISSTDDGIYMQTNKSWSIDDRRLNFQFGCERAYEIRGGRRIRLLKNPTYRGRSPQFWSSCDAVCGPDSFELWGLTNCGKGQPGQLMAMSHGASPARFVRTSIQSGGSR
jgi:TldD protein